MTALDREIGRVMSPDLQGIALETEHDLLATGLAMEHGLLELDRRKRGLRGIDHLVTVHQESGLPVNDPLEPDRPVIGLRGKDRLDTDLLAGVHLLQPICPTTAILTGVHAGAGATAATGGSGPLR